MIYLNIYKEDFPWQETTNRPISGEAIVDVICSNPEAHIYGIPSKLVKWENVVSWRITS